MATQIETLVAKIENFLKSLSITDYRNLQNPNTYNNIFVRMSKCDLFLFKEGWIKQQSIIDTWLDNYSDGEEFKMVKSYTLKGVYENKEKELETIEKELKEIISFFNI